MAPRDLGPHPAVRLRSDDPTVGCGPRRLQLHRRQGNKTRHCADLGAFAPCFRTTAPRAHASKCGPGRDGANVKIQAHRRVTRILATSEQTFNTQKITFKCERDVKFPSFSQSLSLFAHTRNSALLNKWCSDAVALTPWCDSEIRKWGPRCESP